MPASKSVATNIKNLKASETKRPQRQILAIALAEAREQGNKKIAPPPKKGG